MSQPQNEKEKNAKKVRMFNTAIICIARVFRLQIISAPRVFVIFDKIFFHNIKRIKCQIVIAGEIKVIIMFSVKM